MICNLEIGKFFYILMKTVFFSHTKSDLFDNHAFLRYNFRVGLVTGSKHFLENRLLLIIYYYRYSDSVSNIY